MFKVNNEDNKMTTWRRFDVFIVNCEHIPHFFQWFYCWLWIDKCLLGTKPACISWISKLYESDFDTYCVVYASATKPQKFEAVHNISLRAFQFELKTYRSMNFLSMCYATIVNTPVSVANNGWFSDCLTGLFGKNNNKK